MSDIRSRKKKSSQGELSFQNMENSGSIPSETRTEWNNGEPIHRVLEESN